MKPYLVALMVWLDLRNRTGAGVNIYCILMVIRYSLNTGIQCLILKLSEEVYGYLTFTCVIRAILFGQIRKTWSVIWGYAIFLLVLVCSADLDVHCGLFSHSVKFSSFVFINKISTQVVCVSGKHPMLAPGSTVKPACATTSHKRQPIQTKTKLYGWSLL